ncbi:Asp23/Gls24 family envelope stress response protein [Kineococcus rubinsiae]|uniref:Asp23/Gls24 family envelope stress response protein n=1 Tax=Kineococcus rubinsiae TaxID=2609562 RepID=UPI00143172BD|nr:Asp23/Gls24 family envelope stress response protein [Kineococcus rubinsiae]
MLENRAVERIAEAAVGEVPGVIASQETAGTLATALGRAYPRVDVHVAGRRVRVQADIVTRWPLPAAQVAAAVREHVAERLSTLADLDIDTVDVEVAKVLRPTTPERKRVR